MLLFFLFCFVFFQVFAHDQQILNHVSTAEAFGLKKPPATEARQVARNVARGKVTF